MSSAKTFRYGAAGLVFGGLAVLAAVAPAQSQSNLIQDGKAGFVIADIEYALTDLAGSELACPDGLSMGAFQAYAATPEGQQREDESDQEYRQRVFTAVNPFGGGDGPNLCLNPEAGAPDPHMHPVASAAPAYGIDLDGTDARTGSVAAGTCAHNDFRGVDGGRGIDNQFFRAVGCTRTFQPGGQANDFASEMLTGSWGILLALEDVQDLRNDDNVVVHFYANADPIQLSPSREPLADVTYAAGQDPRYQATTRGRIVNGVLTSEPVDARFHYTVNAMRLDRPLNDARLRLTISADGAMEGYLAGYAPVEEIYDTVFGFRTGRTADGELAPVRARAGSAGGYAGTAGHTCNGVYHALRQMADGDRDPETGECNSISIQYRIRAVPAFVISPDA